MYGIQIKDPISNIKQTESNKSVKNTGTFMIDLEA